MKKISMFVAAVATVASMGTAMAATDGSLGGVSTGNFEINYEKGAQIQVWGFKDVFFKNAAGNEHTETMSLCAMTTSGNLSFKVDSRFYMHNTEDKGAYSITIADKGNAGRHDTWGTGGLAANANGVEKFTAKNALENGATTDTCDATYQVANLTVDLNDRDLGEGTYKQLVTVTAFPI